ncbi:hypothetical protein [Aeromonas veronii]
MLKVTADEHRLNFRTLKHHRDALDTISATDAKVKESIGLLLTFYSVEVGFKYLLNSQEKIPFRHEKTNKKDEDVEGFSHNLDDIIARLKIPASRLPSPPQGPFQCGTQNFILSQSHEAWRYGLTVDARHQADINQYMEKITKYLLQEVPE